MASGSRESELNPWVDMIAHHARLLQVSTFCMATWGCVWVGLMLFKPTWYKRFNTGSKNRKFAVGLMISLSFKLLTIPSCALAAYKTPPEDDVAGIHPYMNDYQQICWGSRGTNVILELFHYIGNTELMVHHGLVLLIMTTIGVINGPHRGFDLSLGALVSEFPSLSFSIIRELGLIGKYPYLETSLLVVGAGLTLAVRVPAVFICMAMLPSSGIRGTSSMVALVAYLFYLVYNLNISWRRLRKAGFWQSWQCEGGDWDFGIKVTSHFMISSTAFFAGLGTLVIQVLALALYSIFDIATKDRLIYATGLSVPALLVAAQVLQRNEACRRQITYTAHKVASIQLPKLGTVTAWTLGFWILSILRLVSVGDLPEEHNKDLDPRVIVARSLPFCELVLTWQFWLCATTALLFPMFVVRAQSDTHSQSAGKGPCPCAP